MLLRFGVANHRSIRDYQELLLTASKRIQKERFAVPLQVVGEYALPVAAFYGANASGKSNLLDAMADMERLVVNSHKGADSNDRISRDPFRLDDVSPAEPTRLDCTFTLGSAHGSEDCGEVFEYGFEYTDTEVIREWLYRTVRRGRQSTHRLFERETGDGGVNVAFGPQLRGENQAIARLTRPNSLFLSAAAQNNHPQLTPVQEWFADRWYFMQSGSPMFAMEAAEALFGYRHIGQLKELLVQADAGIAELTVDEVELEESQQAFAKEFGKTVVTFLADQLDRDLPDGFADAIPDMQLKQLKFAHLSSNGLRHLDYDAESRGTRMLLSLLIPALEVLAVGGLLVVDELDSSLHPNLAQAFLSLFETAESNPRGAQLIFSTHDVALLGSGLLSHDEIWITEKNGEGTTNFTPLTDYRVRSRVDVEMGYRNGRFGGTPNLQHFLLAAGRS